MNKYQKFQEDVISEAVKIEPINWNIGKGDWAVAKAEGRKIFAQYNKKGNTDKVLALKNDAGAAANEGSYLGAVLAGLANDYFDRLR